MFTTPDLADELAAGAPYPVRDVTRPAARGGAVALLRARHSWWLRAAQEYTRQAERGTTDAILDTRRALAAAKQWAA